MAECHTTSSGRTSVQRPPQDSAIGAHSKIRHPTGKTSKWESLTGAHSGKVSFFAGVGDKKEGLERYEPYFSEVIFFSLYVVSFI